MTFRRGVVGHGMVSCTNLSCARVRRRRGPTIALNAHGDVVPPGERWTRRSVRRRVRDGVMYGRGVAVSKSDFATYAFALGAAGGRRCGAALDGSIELHFTYDEETGGRSVPRGSSRSGLTQPDFAISAGFSYAITTAHNGCLHLEVK